MKPLIEVVKAMKTYTIKAEIVFDVRTFDKARAEELALETMSKFPRAASVDIKTVTEKKK